MLRQIKPRNARSKRALEKRAPKAIENPKTVLFLRGTTCSQVTQDALADLFALRQPLAKKFTKKNAIHPFEDASSLEFFSEKNDASFLVFGSSSKKRPHCLTFARTFGGKILDMLELYLDPESMRTLKQFKGKKPAIGLRPMVVFAGTAWESTVQNEYTVAKSMLTDFFCGERTADKIDVEGLQYVVVLTADEGADVEGAKPAIHLRVYLIQTKRSGQKLPRVEVEEMGPRMDFRVGRMQEPEENMLKEALKKARGTEEKTKKNVSMDVMGDKIGRIHMGKLDLSDLQTRKMKGLKRGRGEDVEVADAEDDEGSADEEVPIKRRK
ncbi:rRNA-binding ribosome biosynthesis protein rpf2 [Gnomoniopsis sp. IMI 355080]|nr:rRNA-binding ribosome biosynthesis protein rpf2 [Gnomoniopsis sp. IMI 355080]